MKHKRWLLLFGVLTIAALFLAACGPSPAPETEEPPMEEEQPMEEPTAAPEEEMPMMVSNETEVVVHPGEKIRIGASIGLTGPLPDPGADIEHGVRLAEADINAMGGIDGFEVEVDVQDGACDGDAGTNVANLFAADPSIVAVSGGMCSGETIGLQPILQEARIPFMSPSATNPAVLSADCDVCNRLILTDEMQSVTDAEFIYGELGFTRIALMHDGSDYGLGLAELLQTAYEDLGGEVTALQGIQVGDTDFRSVLTLIAADEPEMVFFGGYATEAGLIAAQMKETGLENAVFFSDDGALTDQFLDAAGPAAEGAYISAPKGDSDDAALAEFVAKYEDEFGVEPNSLGPFHAHSYDTVMVIADAIQRAGVVDDNGDLIINREDIVAAVRGTTGFQGLTGNITCNEIGECGAGGIQITHVEDGEFVQVYGFGL